MSISRRSFLKYIGGSTAALSSFGCIRNIDNISDPEGEMTYRINPKTGDKISLLGYGCMRWPTINGESGREEDEVLDQEQINRLVDHAIEHGVNYFDTSPAYCKGRSEEATGIALSRHPREKYFIATKLSNFAPETQTREKSIEMFENSLKYLKTDYIDYELLHAVGGGDDAMATFNQRYIDNGILDYLAEQREKGRIKNLGWSFHGDVKIFDYLLSLHDKYKWDFVQIQLNYVDWHRPDDEAHRNIDAKYLYDELVKRNIPAVIMEPLLGGQLATLSSSQVAMLKEADPNASVASWAFRFAGTPENVLTVLSGMTYMEHLKDNLLTYSPLKPITPEEDEMLKKVTENYLSHTTIPCTGCQYCMPCPFGLDIPAIFSHYNKCVKAGKILDSANDPDYARYRKEFLIGMDKSVPRLRQAAHCVSCGACVSHCPQKIEIPTQLAAIDSYTEKLKNGTL